MPEHPNKSGHFNQKWHDYYTEKRIVHQWMQVHLLKDLPVRRILEIGPYLGLVTAMLRNAGYQTTILDLADAPIFPSPDVPRIAGDIRDLDGGALATGEFDAILCCAQTGVMLRHPVIAHASGQSGARGSDCVCTIGQQ